MNRKENKFRKVDFMSKPILFKRIRKSVIRKLSNSWYRKRIERFDYSFFTILELFYIMFHFKEMNEILDSYSRE